MSCLLWHLQFTYSPFSSAQSQAADDDYDSSDDESYDDDSGQEDISLGSQDTDIDEDEIQDIEAEANTMPAARKPSLSKTKTPPKKPAAGAANSAKKSSSSIDDLTATISKASINERAGMNFDFISPKLQFTYRNNTKDLAVYEVLTTMGSNELRHVTVLPGGDRVSLLFGYPRLLSTERFNRKVLEHVGIKYDSNLAQVTQRSTQVGHQINTLYEPHETLLDGEPQIIPLPFKCLEGPIPDGDITWFRWYKGKKEDVEYKGSMHKQFFNVMIFHTISQHTYIAEKKDQHQAVLDDSEDSDIDQEQDDGIF